MQRFVYKKHPSKLLLVSLIYIWLFLADIPDESISFLANISISIMFYV